MSHEGNQVLYLVSLAATDSVSAARGIALSSVDTAKPINVVKWYLDIKQSHAILSDLVLFGNTTPLKSYPAH